MSNIIEIGGGASGGSNVVANPVEAASDTLSKIGIDGTVYEVSGGGGGSFIDTDTIIQAETAIPANTDVTYTAVQNCAVIYYINIAANSNGIVSVDGVSVSGGWRTALTGLRGCVFLKAGQTILLRQTYTSENGSYAVYGVLGGSSGGASGHSYSTSEQIVGTWINGSTVYEKTFDFSYANIETWSSDALGLNIDKVVYLFAYVKLGTQGGSQWITSPFIESSNYRCDCHYQSSDDKFYVKSNWSSTNAIITIRYTKTSA